MLIIHEPGEDVAALRAAAAAWPGPHVLSLVDGFDRPDAWMRTLREDFLMVDHAGPPVSRLDALRTTIVTLRRVAPPKGPFYFCRGTPDQETLDRARADLSKPFALAHDSDPEDGGLARLALGKRITEGGLFVTFFERMTAGLADSETEGALGILRQHLVPA